MSSCDGLRYPGSDIFWAITLKRYSLHHGKLPATLDALVP